MNSLPVFRLFRLLPFAFCLLTFCLACPAADTPAPASSPAVRRAEGISPDTMDRSMRDVLNRREFTWRNPRADNAPPAEKDARPGVIARFFKNLFETLDRWFQALRHWLDRDREKPVESRPESSDSGGGIGLSLRPILYVLVILCVAAVLLLLYRVWRARRSARALVGKALSAGSAVLPDVADEAVLADQLPEDEWLALARRLLERGEHRLALRAFYLSALSGLGGRGLLGIARHKSNRDYQGELRRRARDRAGLQETFARLVGRFERVWYGSYPADGDVLAAFQDDRNRLASELPAPPAPELPAIHAVPVPA